MVAILIGGNVLLIAATRLTSVMFTTLVLRMAAMLAALMASPLAYASDIQAKPIYRRKAVKRLCVYKYEMD